MARVWMAGGAANAHSDREKQPRDLGLAKGPRSSGIEGLMLKIKKFWGSVWPCAKNRHPSCARACARGGWQAASSQRQCSLLPLSGPDQMSSFLCRSAEALCHDQSHWPTERVGHADVVWQNIKCSSDISTKDRSDQSHRFSWLYIEIFQWRQVADDQRSPSVVSDGHTQRSHTHVGLRIHLSTLRGCDVLSRLALQPAVAGQSTASTFFAPSFAPASFLSSSFSRTISASTSTMSSYLQISCCTYCFSPLIILAVAFSAGTWLRIPFDIGYHKVG